MSKIRKSSLSSSAENTTIGRAAMVYLPSKILEGIIGVWTLSYTADCLSYDAYDRFSTVNTFVVFANLLFLGWIINSTTRYVGDYRKSDGYRGFCSTTAALWVLPNLLSFLICSVVALITHETTAYAAFFMLASTSIYQIALGMLVQTGKQNACAAVSIGSALAKPAVMWIFAQLLTGGAKVDRILPAAAGYALSELLSGLVAIIILKVPQNLRFKGFSREVAKKFAAYGVPLLGVSVSVGLLNMVDRFIIMLFAGDFGIYNANNTIASTVFTMLNTGIIRAVYPATLQAFRKGGKTEAQPFLNRGTRLYLLLAAPAAAGLCGISRQLSALIYRSDPHYVSGSSVIAIVAVAMLFSGLNEYAIKTWELRAQTVKIMQNALISVGIKIACSCALLPLMGFSGAAIGSLIGFLAYFLISYFRAKSSFVFHLSRRTVLSVTVGSVLCGVAAWVISGAIARPVPAILCAIPAGVFAYGAVMVISGELREEIGKLSARLRRS